jgi:signal transduction histidine kinase
VASSASIPSSLHASVRPPLNRHRLLLWVLGVAGVAAAAAASIGTAQSVHTELRGLWIAGSTAITVGFLGAGLLTWSRRPDNRVGPLMVAVAYAWVLSDLVFSNNSFLYSVGTAFSQLFIAVTIHLLLVFPTGRFSGRLDRLTAVGAYLAGGVLYATANLFVDPASYDCTGCPANALLVADNKELADALASAVNWVFAAVALGGVLSLARRWLLATPVQRQALAAVVFAGAALLILLFAATTILPLTGNDPTMANVLSIAALVPFGLVPYVFLGSLFRARMLRGGAFRELVAGLSTAPGGGELRDALAKAVGDPSLELAYWVPDVRQYVDLEGRPVALPNGGSGRAITEVRLEDRLVAALEHDASLLDDPEHVRGVGAAAALALENERLEAELRAKVEELRSSRARLVEETAAERRRLERDLHDGAQQRLVSLALDLRLAEGRVADDPRAARELLQTAGGELEAALDELRELARGIHPAILSDRGLDAALATLAHRAHVPVELETTIEERLPESVELAAYFVVAEALTNVARYANASRATVRTCCRDACVVVEVSDDGVGGADPAKGSGLQGLADRLAALDGRLDVRSEPGAGTVLRAEIPFD